MAGTAGRRRLFDGTIAKAQNPAGNVAKLPLQTAAKIRSRKTLGSARKRRPGGPISRTTWSVLWDCPRRGNGAAEWDCFRRPHPPAGPFQPPKAKPRAGKTPDSLVESLPPGPILSSRLLGVNSQRARAMRRIGKHRSPTACTDRWSDLIHSVSRAPGTPERLSGQGMIPAAGAISHRPRFPIKPSSLSSPSC